MASKDDLEIEYEAAVLDIRKEDLANDLFNSDITIWLTYALGELSKYEAWLKENSMDNTKNMNYVSKVFKISINLFKNIFSCKTELSKIAIPL